MQALAASGRALADQYASTLKKIEAKYGVPGPILLALWGRETGYGRAKLPYEAVDVLATSAFMSTRQELFTRELIDALHIIDGKDIAADAMLSSSAGALGQPQFMPSSFLQYAVDFDGDGHRNIWTSVPDSLASMANFLVQKAGSAAATGGSKSRYRPASPAPRKGRIWQSRCRLGRQPALAVLAGKPFRNRIFPLRP